LLRSFDGFIIYLGITLFIKGAILARMIDCFFFKDLFLENETFRGMAVEMSHNHRNVQHILNENKIVEKLDTYIYRNIKNENV
jgi:hypothetical protein